MLIKGLIKTSLLDFPGRVALVAFTGGCNFRCPFCQNSELVLAHRGMADIPLADIWALLSERRGFVDGLVVSGGEPTLQPDLADFLSEAKKLGVAVKLDTNGYRPALLGQLITSGLVEYVAMDVKSIPSKYSRAAGVALDISRIEESIELLVSSGIPHELRSTVAPGILDPGDIDELADMIDGAQRYVLQQYRPDNALSVEMRQVEPYSVSTLEAMAARMSDRGVPTSIRGI